MLNSVTRARDLLHLRRLVSKGIFNCALIKNASNLDIERAADNVQ